MNPIHEFAASIIARIGLSPADRLIFGAALVCDATEQLKLNPPPGFPNMFAHIEVDESEPFKTAIAALQVLDNNPQAAHAVHPEEV